MDSEIRTPVAPARRGVAMFIVLGAILLVTLFGAVALTLAQRDQTLSGDLNDIKSRDEAALSGLQMAINRLTADPEALLSALNSFVDQSYTKKGKPDSTWLSLDSSTTLRLLDKEPEWFALSNLPGNQTATKIQLVAVQHADITSEVKLDSTQIYVTLRCLARGRRGDEKSVQATYRIHGITGENKNDTLYYTVPRHSFYLGGRYASPNMLLGVEGDVYVGATGNTFINSGADHQINGNLIWNGNINLNTSPLDMSGNLYVNGRISSNGAPVRVNGNLAIANGFGSMSGNTFVSVSGNLYIAGSSSPSVWNAGTGGIRVGKSLYYYPSNLNTPNKLIVGEDAWIVRSGTFNVTPSDSFFVGRDLMFGDPNYDHDGYVINGGQFRVGRSLFGCRKTSVTLPGGSVGDTVQIDSTLRVSAMGNLLVGTTWQAEHVYGNVTGMGAAARSNRNGVMNWRPWPTLDQFGIDTNMAKSTPDQNPMDSVKVDELHSPVVTSSLIPLPALLLNGKITGARLNQLYDSLNSAKKLLNGYMTLRIPQGSPDLDASGGAQEKFRGKMLIVIEGMITVNGNWPSSSTRSNIQVLVVRKGGSLGEFGWKDTLSGIVYWENPCNGQNFKIDPGILVGSMLLGSSLITPGYGYAINELCATPVSLTPNSGRLKILRDNSIFMDIGRNLPGVLAPARDATGAPLSIQGTLNAYYYTPRLRLVHDRPFFEPLGVFR